MLRLEPDPRFSAGGNNAGNLIGGSTNNAVEQPGSGGNVIGGGGYFYGPNIIYSNSNGIFGGNGPSGLKRFDNDVINQSAARWLIIFEGVNDIGTDFRGHVATNLISAYTQFIATAHAHGITAYCATITPFGGNNYFSVRHEEERQDGE